MATVPLTQADRQATLRSQLARQRIGALRQELDYAETLLRDRLTILSAVSLAAIHGVGADSTRPHYTGDLHQLRRQLHRLQRLQEAIGQ